MLMMMYLPVSFKCVCDCVGERDSSVIIYIYICIHTNIKSAALKHWQQTCFQQQLSISRVIIYICGCAV